MRPLRLGSILCLGLAFVTAPALAEAETGKTLRVELTGPDAAHFTVENLVGTMRITSGSGDAVTVIATIYAESQSLADAVRLERAPADGGAVSLRVRYPYDRVHTFRYRAPGDGYDGFFPDFFSGSAYHYDGHTVRVSPGHGTYLHADLEVQVPRARVRAMFRNLVGLVEAEGLGGELRFDVESADLRLRRLDGEITLNGSSGDVRARDIRGSWRSDFSSGDCVLDAFNGETLFFRASSGDLTARDVKARRVETETSSGDARFSDTDVEEFHAEATSGDVRLESVGSRLRSVEVTTSSGDVTLRLPRDAKFDAEASQSSGDMDVGFSDGTAVRRHDSLVGYRRGSGDAHIHVKTSSGDLSITPD